MECERCAISPAVESRRSSYNESEKLEILCVLVRLLLGRLILDNMVITCFGAFFTLMQMYRFTVHGFERSKTLPSVWVLAVYTFGHKDQQTCQMWVNRINESLNVEVGKPKNLMVCLVIGQTLYVILYLACLHFDWLIMDKLNSSKLSF